MVIPGKDEGYLDHLRDYYAENRRIPSMQRIAELMRFASKTASRKLLERLAEAGFVQRAPDDDAWIPARRFFERPLTNGSVRAGPPDAVDGADAGAFMIDDYLVRHPSRTVMIPVRGDSMVEAGIHEGDVAVVERAAEARPGDFVVAVVDGEFTLKELAVEDGRSILKPRNAAYPVIRPAGRLEIFGVMVGLARRLQR
ncbi:MAG: LexA family transcriptional regulator [Candidatus Accumulibacter sp.]|jgi:repressor LexA|nr:LexA family transcriptional regulator [Accumulibacter sp.]